MKALLVLLALAACKAPALHSPVVNAAGAAASTFKITVDEDGLVSSGTAWIVASSEFASVLVTAGHVCEDEAEYAVIDRFGVEHPVVGAVEHPKYDLCALISQEPLGPALDVSEVDLALYDQVQYFGAPLGVFGCDDGVCGMAPYFTGLYAGGNLFTAPGIGGSSGSAVLNARFEVVGVLVAGYRSFPHLMYMEPRAHLVEFLNGL